MEKLISQLKLQNRLVNVIRCQPQISKSALSEILKLSWPTVSNNIDILKNLSILDTSDGLCINPDFAHMIGLSVGAAQIKLSIVDMNFTALDCNRFIRIIEELDIFLDARKYMKEKKKEVSNYIFFRTPDNLFELQTQLNSIMEDIAKIVEKQGDYNLNVISLGIAFTGAIDNAGKKIVRSHNLEYLSDKQLNNIIYPNMLDYFEQKNINIYMDNNSNASVVAEKYHMYRPDSNNYKYRDKKNILSLYLGTGIGAGMVLNNRLYHGASNFVGEIGHLELSAYPGISVKATEACCSCGSRECLDYRIRNDVFEMTKATFSELDSKAVRAFFADYPEKREMFAWYMGKIVNILVNILNLDMIIFTGKFKEVADEMWPFLYKQINANKLSYIANVCELKSSELGAVSPSIGVAICAYFDKIKEEIEW